MVFMALLPFTTAMIMAMAMVGIVMEGNMSRTASEVQDKRR